MTDTEGKESPVRHIKTEEARWPAVTPGELLLIRSGWRGEQVNAPEIGNLFETFTNRMVELGYSKEELRDFEKEFRKGFYTIKEVYKRGGNFAGFNFEKCDLSSHKWEHIKADIASVLEITPGFINNEIKSGRKKKKIWKVKALLWGTLIHDLFYLMTNEAEKEGYRSSGELFFDHCQKSAQNSQQVLEFMEKNLRIDLEMRGAVEAGRLEDGAEIFGYIENIIKMTEFNKLEGEEGELRDFFKDDYNFARIAHVMDLLSYFEDPRQIPWGTIDLWKEHQAKVPWKKEGEKILLGERARKFLEEKAANQSLPPEQRERFRQMISKLEQGRLLIREAKFPGENFFGFVASDFVLMADEYFQLRHYVDCADFFWEKKEENRIRNNWEVNTERILALREFATIAEEKQTLAFFEGGLSGSQLEQVFLDFTSRDWIAPDERWREQFPHFNFNDSTFWVDVDKRMLARKGRLTRLATDEIKALLLAVKEERQAEALAMLFDRFKENIASGEEKVTLYLKIAPEAYKGILTENPLEKIFEAVNLTNESTSNVQLEIIYCARRNKEDEVTLDKADKIVEMFDEGKIRGVNFAGEESGREHGRLSNHEEFLERLIGNNVPLLIQAGQVFSLSNKWEDRRDAANLAWENMTCALDLVEKAKKHGHDKVALEGFQRLPEVRFWLPDKIVERERVEIVERLLSADVPLIVSPIYDREMGFEKNTAVVVSRIAKELQKEERLGFNLGNVAFSGGGALAVELLAFAIESAEAKEKDLASWQDYVGRMRQLLINARQANIFSETPQTST